MSSTKKDWKKHFHRMKQIADQNLGRAEKSEVLNEDLVLLEKRVSKIKTVCQSTIKKLTACLPLSGTVNPDKNIRKLPESILALTMLESANMLGNEDVLGKTYGYCAKLQSSLAREIYQYSQQIEKLVLSPIQSVLESEIPVIAKLRKQLTKLTLDMDSAKGRFHSVVKQSHGSSSTSMASKVETMKNELEQAENRVQQCRDQLIIELYSFLAREGQLSDVLLALVTSQIDFHRRTLESLENSLPQMKHHTEVLIPRPVFGCSLVAHLDHTSREIAFVIERCVRSLILHGIDEEGLFRVASSSTKVKKLKAGFDASIVNMDDYQEDAHCVAAVLKSYLRELPEPLMTFELYSEWMHIMELPTELRQNALWVVVDKLPRPNYNNLRYIIKFLAKLAANSNVNKMSPSNIAIVIGPNLLWGRGDDGPSVLSAASHSAIIECLINKSEWFFPGDLDFGVTETDRFDLTKTRLNDNLSSISSSALTQARISKHRFFGNVFDEADHNGLKMSPSNTRLSLNSLTSLNDDSSFERKYSFSSLLEERTSNWDSEGGSLRWLKMSRVESGTSSLNTSFCYANRRSPIPSSSTSPALSAGNILSFDASCSVTKSPTLSVTTSSSRLSGNGGPSPLVTFGVGPSSGRAMSACERSDSVGSRIPMSSAGGKNTIPLVSIAKASTMLVNVNGTLTRRNNGLITASDNGLITASDNGLIAASSHHQSLSASSDVSVTRQSLTTGSESAVSTTPDMSVTLSQADDTVASMSEKSPVSTSSIPIVTVVTDASTMGTTPAVIVTSSQDTSRMTNPNHPTVTVTSSPTELRSTTSQLSALPSTSTTCISNDDDNPNFSTPTTHENDSSELITSKELADALLSDTTSSLTDNYPIVASASEHHFDPLMSGDRLRPISFSRHVVISPTSPSAISDSSRRTSDEVFNSVEMSPGNNGVGAMCPSDVRKRSRVFSDGSWKSIPNGDCYGESGLSFGKVSWLDSAGSGRGVSEGSGTGLSFRRMVSMDNPNARRGASESSGAPGKDRVRFLSRASGSTAFKEWPGDRRLSIPSESAISPESPKPKQPIAKSGRSQSITSSRTLPYIAPSMHSTHRKTTTASDRHGKALSDGNATTQYEKNRESLSLCNDSSSAINCGAKTSVHLSRGILRRQESVSSPAVENSPTREISGNSDENPFDGGTSFSNQGVVKTLDERRLCNDKAGGETAFSSGASKRPKTNRDGLFVDCECGGFPGGSVGIPPSPLSSADKKSPHQTLQRPLFPPPDIPTKNTSSTSD